MVMCECVCHSLRGSQPGNCCPICWTNHFYLNNGMLYHREETTNAEEGQERSDDSEKH
jgi:hypothetical protein